jgi:hypothetical protein
LVPYFSNNQLIQQWKEQLVEVPAMVWAGVVVAKGHGDLQRVTKASGKAVDGW